MGRSEPCEIWRKEVVRKETTARDEGHGVPVGLRESQEGQSGCGLVNKVGADGHELGETERGQIVDHGDEFDLILHAVEVKAP